MIGTSRSLAVTACLLFSATVTRADHFTSATLRTVEGHVLSIGSHMGEGELDLLTVDLAIEGSQAETLQLLLAPGAVFEEIGFSVSEGDRLKARVFVESDGPAPVHKVQNLSKGTVVRLRTLHTTPLWDSTGGWQGSSMRNGRGPHRHGYRGGRGPPS